MGKIGIAIYRYLPLAVYGVLWIIAKISPLWKDTLRRRLALDLPPPFEGKTIWFHAASVGEVSTIAPLVAEVRRRFPYHRLFVSTMTVNGMKRARNVIGAAKIGLLPLDLLPAMRRMVTALKPQALIIGETELWPNLVIEAHRAGVKIVLVNGRISNKSLKWYRAFRGLIGKVLENFDCFLMRTEADGRRIRALGANRAKVQVTGNTKYDILPEPLSPEQRRRIRRRLGVDQDRPVITLGSIRQGEFSAILDALRPVIKAESPLVIVAPRHMTMLPVIKGLIASAGYSFAEIDSASPFGSGNAQSINFLLVAQMGRLLEMYAIADIAIIGGTFKPYGGHNPLESASQGAVTIVGPHIQNISDDIQYLRSHKCAFVIEASRLGQLVGELLEESSERQQIASRAIEAVKAKKGIASKCVDIMVNRGLLSD